jgi:hypothetical protein
MVVSPKSEACPGRDIVSAVHVEDERVSKFFTATSQGNFRIREVDVNAGLAGDALFLCSSARLFSNRADAGNRFLRLHRHFSDELASTPLKTYFSISLETIRSDLLVTTWKENVFSLSKSESRLAEMVCQMSSSSE